MSRPTTENDPTIRRSMILWVVVLCILAAPGANAALLTCTIKSAQSFDSNMYLGNPAGQVKEIDTSLGGWSEQTIGDVPFYVLTTAQTNELINRTSGDYELQLIDRRPDGSYILKARILGSCSIRTEPAKKPIM